MPDHYLVPQRLVQALPGLAQALARFDKMLLAGGLRLLKWLSPRNANRLAAGVFGFFGPPGSKSEKVRRNLRIAFPDKNKAEIDRLTKATFRHLGLAAAELAQAEQLLEERDTRLEVVIEDQRIQPLRPGSPVVLVTAHVGAWQYVALLGQLLGIRLTSLYAPEYNPHVRKLFLPLRQALGCNWVCRDNSARQLMQELANGNWVGLAPDTRFDQGNMLPFFHHEASTSTVAARLALRFNCPLIAARCDRLPGQRYRITLSRLITPDGDCAIPEEQATRMTIKLNREFESWIRRSPGQWLCMKRRWPEEIDGGKSTNTARAIAPANQKIR